MLPFKRKPQGSAEPPKVPEPPAVTSPPVVDPPVVDPPPAFVSVDDFTKFQTTILEKFDNVTNYFMQQQPGRVPPTPAPTTPTIEDVTDEEYENAISGAITDKRLAAQIVRKRTQADIARATQGYKSELEQLKSVGMGAISNLTVQGLSSKPHYKTYKKEIDAAIKQLPPEAQVNSEALNGVYNYIIGQHVDEIIASEREAVMRQAVAQPGTGTPAGRAGTGAPPNTPSSNVPPPSEVFDADALAALHFRFGRGPDAAERFARSQRYDSWEAYYNKIYKPLEETEGNA